MQSVDTQQAVSQCQGLPLQSQIADREFFLGRRYRHLSDLQLMQEAAPDVVRLYLPCGHQIQHPERSTRATAGTCKPDNEYRRNQQRNKDQRNRPTPAIAQLDCDVGRRRGLRNHSQLKNAVVFRLDLGRVPDQY